MNSQPLLENPFVAFPQPPLPISDPEEQDRHLANILRIGVIAAASFAFLVAGYLAASFIFFTAGTIAAALTLAALAGAAVLSDTLLGTRLISLFFRVFDPPAPPAIENPPPDIELVESNLPPLGSCVRYPADFAQNLHLCWQKKYLYDLVVRGGRTHPIELEFAKCRLPQRIHLEGVSLWSPQSRMTLTLQETTELSYPESTDESSHWSGGFGGKAPFTGCRAVGFTLRRQQEVAEHPELYILHEYLKESEEGLLDLKGSALLIKGARRYGFIDSATPIDGFGTISKLFLAAKEEMAARTSYFDPPTKSNIFCIAAPSSRRSSGGQPYDRESLLSLARNVYTACKAIRQCASQEGKGAHVHFSDQTPIKEQQALSDSAMFGHNPIVVAIVVIAVARAAGVDRLFYYSIPGETSAFAAQSYLERLRNESPQMTIGELLQRIIRDGRSYAAAIEESQNLEGQEQEELPDLLYPEVL